MGSALSTMSLHSFSNLLSASAYWAIAVQVLYLLLRARDSLIRRTHQRSLSVVVIIGAAFLIMTGLTHLWDALYWRGAEYADLLNGVATWIVFAGLVGATPRSLLLARSLRTARENQEVLQAVMQNSAHGIVVFSPVQRRGRTIDLRYEMANPAAEEVIGRDPIGCTLLDLFPEHATNGMFVEYARLLETNGRLGCEMPFVIRGERRWFDITAVHILDRQLLVMFHDITRLQARIKTDDLCQIYNRRALEDIDASELFAVIFLDLNGFKQVNDRRGHLIGDRLLQSVVQRILDTIDKRDWLLRLGGDEFAVFITREVDSLEVEGVARQLGCDLDRSFEIEGQQIDISAAIGIAFQDEDHSLDLERILQQADLAMYTAKSQSQLSSQVVVFDHNLEQAEQMRGEAEADLRRGIAAGELVLFYQPIVSILEPGTPTVSLEALVRWQHPTRGLVPPNEFIALAERSDLIFCLFEWVLRTACKQVLDWQSICLGISIAVNVSAIQLGRRSLGDTVTRILQECECPAALIHLEITESGIAMADEQDAIDVLSRLRKIGVLLEIDDFGTGYSSLNRILRLPFDFLKVDRSFLEDAPNALLTAIVEMAKALRLLIIAEGVETEQQVAVLKDLGCQFAQGYLFSRPLPPDEAELFLRMRAGRFKVD
jgi:diguanylate cyclase (GGDEF)-like protein